LKIVFLNTWHGKLDRAISGFISRLSADTDVFCFQEADGVMQKICREILPVYNNFSFQKRVTSEDKYSLITLVKKELQVTSSLPVLEEDPEIGLGAVTGLKTGTGIVNIINFHGLWYPGNKMDIPARLRQSEKLIKVIDELEGQKIIGGDLNLDPDSQSLMLFAETGHLDLISVYKIPNTRNKYAWERFPGNKQHFSDYVFVSRDVEVRNFSVPDVEVSDHQPLVLEI
jgi:endonuclease/exonuclease/phosphatase (EEP) superfamily protein YafD